MPAQAVRIYLQFPHGTIQFPQLPQITAAISKYLRPIAIKRVIGYLILVEIAKLNKHYMIIFTKLLWFSPSIQIETPYGIYRFEGYLKRYNMQYYGYCKMPVHEKHRNIKYLID